MWIWANRRRRNQEIPGPFNDRAADHVELVHTDRLIELPGKYQTVWRSWAWNTWSHNIQTGATLWRWLLNSMYPDISPCIFVKQMSHIFWLPGVLSCTKILYQATTTATRTWGLKQGSQTIQQNVCTVHSLTNHIGFFYLKSNQDDNIDRKAILQLLYTTWLSSNKYCIFYQVVIKWSKLHRRFREKKTHFL